MSDYCKIQQKTNQILFIKHFLQHKELYIVKNKDHNNKIHFKICKKTCCRHAVIDGLFSPLHLSLSIPHTCTEGDGGHTWTSAAYNILYSCSFFPVCLDQSKPECVDFFLVPKKGLEFFNIQQLSLFFLSVQLADM